MQLQSLGLGFDQVGIIVRDIDETIERYEAVYPGMEWVGWTYSPEIVPELEFRGRPAAFGMELALSGNGPQVELIAPLTGPSSYHEWQEEGNTEGLHHIGSRVPELAAGIEAMQAAGFEMVQLGRGYGVGGDGGFAYFDTNAELGHMVELIEVPKERQEPHRRWKDGRRQA